MLERTKKPKSKLSDQVIEHAKSLKTPDKLEANFHRTISTGCTLLDLSISGGIKRGGGLPGGVFVEIFGPPSCGKTVMICEIAGNIQRQGGEVDFYDPEGRLNKAFARMFGLNTTNMGYDMPNTISGVFVPVRKREWQDESVINGVCGDSLAALSTDAEMDDKDQYGMRRAKEFSEELRKTCRIIKAKNILMVCSNQERENVGATQWESKSRVSGGRAIPYYASLRLRCHSPQKIKEEKKLHTGKVVTRITGVETTVEVVKSSLAKPWRSAIVTIKFDYGIDDIHSNLQFLKEYKKTTQYTVGDVKLSQSLKHSIRLVERDGLKKDLRNEVIDLWTEIEKEFTETRQPKYKEA